MKIFNAITDDFSTNGLGQIIPLKCIETKRKSLNGWNLECDVELKYLELIKKDNIVVVETKEKGPQPFIINEPTISSTIVFTADHYIFTAQRYLLADVRPTNLIGHDFLDWCNKRTDTKSPFTVYSNIPSRKTAYFIRKNMLEMLEEAEALFNGVYDIDHLTINFLGTIGKLSDVSLVYGKNINGIKMYENWNDVCTKILPVGPEGLLLPELYIESDIKYKTPYTRTITFSIDKEKSDGQPKTREEMIVELRVLAKQYVDKNKHPKINVTVSADVPQDLKIGDIVPVKHPLVTIETDVQAYRYNVNTKQTISIEYGNYERNVKKEFQAIKNDIEIVNKKTDDFLTKAKDEVDYLMNVAGKNGSVVFRKNEDGVIYEILAMDTKDISTAKTITRFNSQGIAGTSNGINGQFNVAMMANGTIVADMVKIGTLRAIKLMGNDIFGGTININDKFVVDSNGNGIFEGKITSTRGNIGGWVVDSNGFTNGTAKIDKSGITNIYTWSDLYIVRLIIVGTVVADNDMISHYDFNGDGKITAVDYMLLKQKLKAL